MTILGLDDQGLKKMNGRVALINDALKSPNHKTYFGLVF